VWQIQTERSVFVRLIVGILLWSLIGAGLPEALRWVKRRQAIGVDAGNLNGHSVDQPLSPVLPAHLTPPSSVIPSAHVSPKKPSTHSPDPPAQPVVVLTFHALYVAVRNMPERARVPTWNDAPWDEDDYADVRLTITNALDLPLQSLDLDISVTEGDPKTGIAGIAQLTNVSGVEFSKTPFQTPTLRVRGDDGKSYNIPTDIGGFLNQHRVVSHYGMFCPRLGRNGIIGLILATIHVGDHNRPPDRIKITGTYLTESNAGRITRQISQVIDVMK